MKKIAILTLALVLALLVTCASADTLSEFKQLPEGYYYYTNEFNTLVMWKSKAYQLIDADGNPLSAVYTEMSSVNDAYRVQNENGYGMIDARTGKEVVPCKYDYANSVKYGSGWFAGHKWASDGTEDDYDYYATVNKVRVYYRFISTDVYYDGELMGTLTRDQYNRSSYVTIHGKYVWIKAKSTDTEYTVYDAHMTPLRTLKSTTEYETSYRTGDTTHLPTGQKVFAPECTLQPEDVDRAYNVDKDGNVLDLQGNIVGKTKQPYESYAYGDTNYIVVRLNGKYGVIDLQGNEIVPCECEYISTDSLFKGGYNPVKINGKLAYYSADGTCTVEPRYSADAAKDRGLYAVLEDPTGGKLVITATAGLLPEHYNDIDYKSASYRSSVMTVKDLEDRKGVIDIYGNVLVPFDQGWSTVEASGDGSIIMVRDADRKYYYVAKVTKEEPAGEPEAPVVTPEPAKPEEPAPVKPEEPAPAKPEEPAPAASSEFTFRGLKWGMSMDEVAAAEKNSWSNGGFRLNDALKDTGVIEIGLMNVKLSRYNMTGMYVFVNGGLQMVEFFGANDAAADYLLGAFGQVYGPSEEGASTDPVLLYALELQGNDVNKANFPYKAPAGSWTPVPGTRIQLFKTGIADIFYVNNGFDIDALKKQLEPGYDITGI